METRGPNKQCGHCGGVTRFVRGAIRCVDVKCPYYWQDQGGIDEMTPNPPKAPVQDEPMPIRITKPT